MEEEKRGEELSLASRCEGYLPRVEKGSSCCRSKWNGWICTRQVGHDGYHAAHYGYIQYFRWENKQPMETDQESKPTTYNFNVSNAADIDLRRIVNENPSALALIVVGANALVLVKNTFLDKFVAADKIPVCGSYLCSNWEAGPNGYPDQCNRKQARFLADVWGGLSDSDCWSSVVIDKSRIPRTLKEIERAKRYKRQLHTEVIVVE